ncbi:hypothetical protein B0H11DRAFT_768232 [Mycena galericulata]|nr:hypothetical protein B0H11DRAFT_768232 [Mycena galericulata]
MVLPPLILCSISLVLCLVSLYHCTRLPPSRFAAHLAARTSSSSSSSASSGSTPTTPRFTRALAQATTFTTAVLIATLFPLFALSPQTASQTQTQTAFPHNADLSVIFVIRNARDVAGAQLVWWAVPVVSIVYIILVLGLGLGDEPSARWDLLSWVAGRVKRPAQRPARPELKLLTINHALAMGSKSPSSSSSSSVPSPAAPHAVQLPLRSGWDDMLDVKKNRLPFGRKSVLSSASSDSSDDTLGTSSPISPKEKEEEAEEEAFTHSTLTYLASPVAQALGLLSPSPSPSLSPSPSPRSSPSTSPSPGVVPPPARTYHAAASVSPPRHRDRPRPLALAPPSASVTPPPKPTPTPTPTPTPSHTLTTHLRPPQQPIPEDTASTISSIWDAPWPLPPPSPRGVRPPAYPMHSPVAPVGMGPPPGVPLKSALKKGKGERRTWSREALARGYAGADVIYMTAVRA